MKKPNKKQNMFAVNLPPSPKIIKKVYLWEIICAFNVSQMPQIYEAKQFLKYSNIETLTLILSLQISFNHLLM